MSLGFFSNPSPAQAGAFRYALAAVQPQPPKQAQPRSQCLRVRGPLTLLGAERQFHFSTDISSGWKTARAPDRLTSKPSFFKRYAEEALIPETRDGTDLPSVPSLEETTLSLLGGQGNRLDAHPMCLSLGKIS